MVTIEHEHEHGAVGRRTAAGTGGVAAAPARVWVRLGA